jgi:hypothetical protein
MRIGVLRVEEVSVFLDFTLRRPCLLNNNFEEIGVFDRKRRLLRKSPGTIVLLVLVDVDLLFRFASGVDNRTWFRLESFWW